MKGLLIFFHLHNLPHVSSSSKHHHHHHDSQNDDDDEDKVQVQVQVPQKGWMAVRVGQEGEEQHKVFVPVVYLNHPLFLRLLKEAEEEYGFDHKGAITIPCHVEYFRQVKGIIDRENGGGHHHHHQFHLHFHFLPGCFRALIHSSVSN